MTDDKRKRLEDRIAAAQERHAARETTFLEDAGELASDAKEGFTQFAREHPLAVVAGGLAAGVLISALFRKSPTRKFGGKAAGLAALGAKFALSYARQAMESAEAAGQTGAGKLADIGDSVSDKARGLSRGAAQIAGGAGGTARMAARKAGKRLGRAIRNRSH